MLSREVKIKNRFEKCDLSGVNEEVVKTLQESCRLKQMFTKLQDYLDPLYVALGSKDFGRRIDQAKILIRSLWYQELGLGPYPFLDTLALSHFDDTFHKSYREHIVHQIQVYLLGLYLYDQLDVVKNWFKSDGKTEEEFLIRWKIASLFHDIGYVFENDKIIKQDPVLNSLLEEISNLSKHPLTHFLNTISHKPTLLESQETEVQNIIKYRTRIFQHIKDIETFDQVNLPEFLDQFGRDVRLGESGISAYYYYASKTIPIKQPSRFPFLDHGILSSLILLTINWTFFEYTKAIVTADSEKIDQIKRIIEPSHFDILSKNFDKADKVRLAVEDAAGAIALHNIDKDLWDHNDAWKDTNHKLTLNSFSVTPQKSPLAFLLILADGLQEWGRPLISPPGSDTPYPLIDQEMYIWCKNGCLKVNFPYDPYQPSQPESFFFRICSGLKSKLKEEELDKIMKPSERLPVSETDKLDYCMMLEHVHSLIDLRSTPTRDLLSATMDELYVPIGVIEMTAGELDVTLIDKDMPLEPDEGGKSLLQTCKRLLLLGEPGTGKSTFLRHMVLKIARSLLSSDRKLAESYISESEPVQLPIFFQLKRVRRDNVHRGVLRLIYEEIHNLVTQSGTFDFLKESLTQGGVIFLLDGLDEIPDMSLRAATMEEIGRLMNTYDRCRFLVTCRTPTWEKTPGDFGAEIETRELAGFDDKAIESFCKKWGQAIARIRSISPTEGAIVGEELWDEIRLNPQINALAKNPLLLTTIAIIRYTRGTVQLNLSELCREIIDLLLKYRESTKGYSSEFPDIEENRKHLQQLALQMHRDNQREIEYIEAERFLGKSMHDSNKFIDFIVERTGILLRSETESGNMLCFSQQTIQEYLAARELADMGSTKTWRILKTALLDPWWKEVIRLLIGTLPQNDANKLVRIIFSEGVKLKDNSKVYGSLLALAMSLLIEIPQIKRDNRLRSNFIDAAMVAISKIGTEKLPLFNIATRAEIGRWLGYLGDPRLAPEKWNTNFITIPSGEFWMGSDDGLENERTHHKVYLEEFEILKFPVTNQDYAEFVKQGGYQMPEFWEGESSQGWLWQKKNNIGIPGKWKEPKWNAPNLPVIEVSYYEANAFCSWLTKYKNDGYIYKLPTEAQWERAARGTGSGRIYPWGNDVLQSNEAAQANWGGYDKRNPGALQGTSPVGIFPHGATPDGLYDIIGNVWERCADWYHSQAYTFHGDYEPFCKEPEDIEDIRKRFRDGYTHVVRGGSWRGRIWINLRASIRSYTHPEGRNPNLGFRVIRKKMLTKYE